MIEGNKIWWDSGILIRERASVISLVMVNGTSSVVKESLTRKISKNFLLQSHKTPQYSYLLLTCLCLINGKTIGLCVWEQC